MNRYITEYISPNIFQQGRQFYLASIKLCEENDNSLPSFVCMVFAIELFIKSLRATKLYKDKFEYPNGTFSYNDLYDQTLLKKDHNLSKLYCQLGNTMKEEIENEYFQKYNSDIVYDIENIKDGFQYWRYMYEGKTYCIHKSSLLNVGEFFYEYVKKRLNIK